MIDKKPSLFEEIRHQCPDIPEDRIRMHLDRLDEPYFRYYNDADLICAHVRQMQSVTPDSPFVFSCEFKGERRITCTILSFDYPALFSLITGILAGMGVGIESGAIFTYSEYRGEPPPGARPKARRRVRADGGAYRKKIIDTFEGLLETNLPHALWLEEIEGFFGKIFSLLEHGDGDALQTPKRLVNELVVKKLQGMKIREYDVLYPAEVTIDNSHPRYTCLKVLSIDTPFFLYAFSTALSLKGILVEYVNITTASQQIEDEFHIVDVHSEKISDPQKIDLIKFTVLLTKQFTYFLGLSPDPYAALSRFEYLADELMKYPEQGRWVEMLSSPDIMKDLARLLGTSDQLWEDFVRLQYESIIPMLTAHAQTRSFAAPPEELSRALDSLLDGTRTEEEAVALLNQFKDREIFLLDLDHILNPEYDFRSFSEKLTGLAEAVVGKAQELAYRRLVSQYGTPRTIAGLEPGYCMLGLGKFGGAAIGYASDIELLFVYSDNGATDGPASINNAEFFNRMVQELLSIIKSKREGIFRVDLRLRPYGSGGPLATSLDAFCRYYGTGGDAHSYERLSLVRMRAVAGDAEFGAMLERLRDEFVYLSRGIDPVEIFALRKKQYREKSTQGRVNAKFSPGALVDLEYAVQLLQVIHGKDYVSLRTPRIHRALEELARHGLLEDAESGSLVSAYDFLRRLINGLRILRGSANDLLLPESGSIEYAHLARRMGYETRQDLLPEQQLYLEFETHTAQIRLFVERHFGRSSLPGKNISGVADLILSTSVPEAEQRKILEAHGFKNTGRALVNFRSLSSKTGSTHLFAMLAVLACDLLQRKPDADMALNNWERFVSAMEDPRLHYETMLAQPRELDILLTIFSGSQFLSDTLIRNPEFLEWVIVPDNLYRKLSREELTDELLHCAGEVPEQEAWLNGIRRIRRREFLRIGTRDMYLNIPLEETVSDLSACAEAFIQAAMEHEWGMLAAGDRAREDINRHFCILAFGKLGGLELNYSSDIDLLGVYAGGTAVHEAGDAHRYATLMERIRHDLAAHTDEGHCYRVDLRLRPYGSSGLLVDSLNTLRTYYLNSASVWEVQALLKMRPVAGNLGMGTGLYGELWPGVMSRYDRLHVVSYIKELRKKSISVKTGLRNGGIDIKNGEGGIRDIEFLVQGLQLVHGAEFPDIICGNTLDSLALLNARGLIPAEAAERVRSDYILLRRVEHFLQLFEDRQVHTLPASGGQLMILAKRMLGGRATREQFNDLIASCRARVRECYDTYLSQD